MRFLPKAALIALAAVSLVSTAEAIPMTFRATLSDTAEAPPNASPGFGSRDH